MSKHKRTFSEADSRILFEALQEMRMALRRANDTAPFGSEVRHGIDRLWQETAALGEILTGDARCFEDPPPTSPPRLPAPRVRNFRTWK